MSENIFGYSVKACPISIARKVCQLEGIEYKSFDDCIAEVSHDPKVIRMVIGDFVALVDDEHINFPKSYKYSEELYSYAKELELMPGERYKDNCFGCLLSKVTSEKPPVFVNIGEESTENPEKECGPLQKIYEEKFKPLTEQIHTLANEYGINYVASYQLDKDENAVTMVGSQFVTSNASEQLKLAAHILNAEKMFSSSFKVKEDKDE